MAIYIKSRNIFEKKNPKVKGNMIDRIDISPYSAEISKAYDTPVFTQSFYDNFESSAEGWDRVSVVQNIPFETDTATNNVYYVRIAYASIIPVYYTGNVKIKAVKNKTAINDILLKREFSDNQFQPATGYSVYGEIEEGTFEQPFRVIYDRTPLDDSAFSFSANKLTSTKLKPPQNIPISSLQQAFQRKETQEVSDKDPISADLSKTITKNETNLGSINSTFVEMPNPVEDYYEIKNIKLLVGALSLGGKHSEKVYFNTSGGSYGNSLYGTYTRYIPKRVDVTFYGNTTSLELNQENLIVGDPIGVNPQSFQMNELVQYSNFYISEDTNSIEKQYNNTLYNYINGKETAELLCSVGEYYDENGNLAISTKDNALPMLFNQGDIVIPMVFAPNGNDVPMSAGKKFEVIGVEPIYDGAVWQKLTIQEIKS